MLHCRAPIGDCQHWVAFRDDGPVWAAGKEADDADEAALDELVTADGRPYEHDVEGAAIAAATIEEMCRSGA